MTPPKCKLCGDRHYGVCSVSVDASPPGLSDRLAAEAVAEASGLPVAEVEKVLSQPAEKKSDATLPDVKVSENDTCPTCGTNLAARAKERERRRLYMKRKRAEGKDG